MEDASLILNTVSILVISAAVMMLAVQLRRMYKEICKRLDEMSCVMTKLLVKTLIIESGLDCLDSNIMALRKDIATRECRDRGSTDGTK